MLSVLIADDEKKVGLLIKRLIEWERLGLSFLDIVQDGQSAYKIIREKKPDIVITDIRMPELSGLELVKKVTEEGLPVHFIIISGYRYFEYAQKALKYGVKDYLLKPIDETELNRILKKICDEAAEKQNLDEKVETLEKNLISSRHILHRELMDRVFDQDDNIGEDSVSKEYAKSVEIGLYLAAGFKVDRDVTAMRNAGQEQLIMQKLSEKASESLQENVIDSVISIKNEMWMMVLLNYREECSGHIRELLKEMFAWMKRYISGFEKYEITMGLSPETAEYSQINLILEMAREAVEGRILTDSGVWLEEYFPSRNRKVKAADIISDHEEQFRKSISVFQGDAFREAISSCFEDADSLRIMACEYYELGRSLAAEYGKLIKEMFREEKDEQILAWQETVGHCRTVSILTKYIGTVLAEDLELLGKRQRESERKPVLDAIAYVKQNYGRKILLEDVAAMSGFNANYFSEIFKKETGKNFTAFLLEVRIEASKELLSNTSKTVYEIASDVGYKDVKFFSQQFTKVVGIKPKEYRRLYY